MPLKDYKKVPTKKKVAAPVQAPVEEQSNLLVAWRLFILIMLGAIGYLMYDRFFNNHATQLTSLMNEYRSDKDLSSLSIASKSKKIAINGSSSLIRVFDDYKSGFKIDNPELDLNLDKSDSSFAISELIEGKVDLALFKILV